MASGKLRSGGERELCLFESVVVVKLGFKLADGIPDMRHRERVGKYSDWNIRQRFLGDACRERCGKHISDAYDSGETLHDLLSFFCFCCFDIVFITAFCRAVFLSADVGEIVLAETLVDFRDGVPASAVLLDATLLHVEINQVLLLLADLAEVMKERPAVHIEGVLDVLQEGAFASVGDVVVSARVAELRVRDADGDFIRLLTVRYYAFGRTDNGEFDKLGLDAAVVQTHGVSATVPMNKPLAQVGGHFYIDVVVAHNIRVEWL